MPKKLLLTINVIFITGLLSACAVDPKDAYRQYQPSSSPVRNVTQFNQALQCFDNLLIKAQLKPIYITSEGIPNHAGSELTLLSGRDMLISTITQLRSNVFKFIDLPSLPASQLLEQLGVAKSHPALFEEYIKIYTRWNKENPYPKPVNYPDYSIIGAITQVDKNVISNGMGAAGSFNDIDVGISKDDMVSVMAMDMNIVDTANFEVLNGVSSSNSIAVYKQGTAGDLGGKIKKAGVYLNFSFDKSEGTHQAIRTLVQLNTLEVLGKLANVPYQQCLPGSETSAKIDSTAFTQTKPSYTPPAPAVIPSLVSLPVVQQPAAQPITNNAAVAFQITATKKHYQLNDVLTFKAQTSEDAHIHCFYQNYKSEIWRVFPNQVQVSDFLIANQPVQIPAQNKAFEIALDKSNVTEQVMCLAAREKLNSDFQSLTVSNQSMLPVSSLGQVFDNYQHKTQEQISKQVLPINVK